jgi:hypothetical protein
MITAISIVVNIVRARFVVNFVATPEAQRSVAGIGGCGIAECDGPLTWAIVRQNPTEN